jgi:hypothetical protein
MVKLGEQGLIGLLVPTQREAQDAQLVQAHSQQHMS